MCGRRFVTLRLSMRKLKCAVICAGYLGKFHAEKYASLKDCELVAVVDINAEAAKAVGEKFGAAALTDYQTLLGQVDAVSIVVPTTLHHAVSRDFLNAGSHVLVEKPITVTVADTGIGMDPEDVEIALQPFGQVDNRLERRYEGTGLGLPLTKALVDLHKGSVVIESARGQGTRVIVTFPRGPLQQLAEAV